MLVRRACPTGNIGGMNAPRADDDGDIQFPIGSPTAVAATEAARVQPDGPRAPAHDAFTRLAAMQIVPAGERIVRAEVDAEFVSRVTDKAGKKVTITDSHHFGHTYEGVVVRVGTSLLPKRGGGDLLAGPPAKVLECRIKITDPAPPGKPPLVVGQPVRVVFGQ